MELSRLAFTAQVLARNVRMMRVFAKSCSPMTSRLVDDLIEQMRETFGVTSLVISHDIASCFRIAHQAVLLIRGKIVARGTPDDLVAGDNAEAREFIHNSGVDLATIKRVAAR